MNARRLIALLGVLVVLAIAARAGTSPDALLAPFVFQRAGAPALLVLRLGILFFVLSALRTATLTQGIVVVALFLLSLAMSGALYPFALVCGWLIARSDEPDPTAHAVLYGSIVVALAFTLVPAGTAPDEPFDARDPQRMTAYWQGRRNPYKARWWALAWTRQETHDPGDAYLTLATIDHDLGREEQARKVLSKVLDHATDAAPRARAASLRALWDKEPAPQ